MSHDEADVAIVGRGMIGSAAARHLAEAGQSVALIGPGEPAEYATAPTPFASHFDEGRITRISDSSSVWAELAARSIQRYADIAARSGIDFHTPRALAHLSLQAHALLTNAEASGGHARLVTREWLRTQTSITFADDEPGDVVFEGAPAGHINPRRLVAAQVALTSQAGGVVVDAPATSVASTRTGFAISTEHGEITARQVLLATGAYGAGLVGVDLDLERRLRTTVHAEIGAAPEMPSLIVDQVHHPELEGIYWVPPVPFPYGRTMLKIGGTGVPTIVASDHAAIDAWFRSGGSANEAAALRDTVRSLLPDTTILSWEHRPCVVTGTATDRPFIGHVADGVTVAIGGNGAAAKSCDEIGHLAASLLLPDGWRGDGLDQSLFTPTERTSGSGV